MRKFLALIFAILMIFTLIGCTDFEVSGGTPSGEDGDDNGEKLAFIADFYDNGGEQWLTAKGTWFTIKPNKVKEYSYDSDGSWISQWTMSSIMSVYIDNKEIESCGSTVLIYDTGLEKFDCVLPENDVTSSAGYGAYIDSPNDLQFKDYWTVDWWWYSNQTKWGDAKPRIVIIQSQDGSPICCFKGDEVTWEVSRNLPKTTELNIDGHMVYVHRANFAIIDTNIFE